jgi:hypothetical protein
VSIIFSFFGLASIDSIRARRLKYQGITTIGNVVEINGEGTKVAFTDQDGKRNSFIYEGNVSCRMNGRVPVIYQNRSNYWFNWLEDYYVAYRVVVFTKDQDGLFYRSIATFYHFYTLKEIDLESVRIII